MTNSNHTVEETVAVIQADLAAAVAAAHANCMAIFEGKGQGVEVLAQAFARHRLASHSTPAGEDVERVARFVEDWNGTTADGDTRLIAAEIRERFGAGASTQDELVDALKKIERAYGEWDPDARFASTALAEASAVARAALTKMGEKM